ncbi:MAG TPA: peptidoglycan-binding protein [Candidatus Paceibacterota bacterium]
MKKYLILLALVLPLAASAQTASSTADLQTLIKQLQAQIAELQAQVQSIKTELKITRALAKGATGDDVKQLQEFLKTIPDVYPEGLVTGYFGPLTEAAVKRWQEKQGIEAVGIVGPKTTAKLNELISQGAGRSGTIPPGLLTAPPIQGAVVAPAVTTSTTSSPVTSAATISTTSDTSSISGGTVAPISPTQQTNTSVPATTTTTATTSSTSAPPNTSAPTTPSDFSMTSSSPGGLNFSWTVSANNVGFGYKIYLTNTNANTTTVLNQGASYGTGSRSFGEGGFVQGVQYTAYIVTVDSTGNVTTSSPIVSVSTAQLTTPANFQASATGPTSVSLTWSASQGNVYQYQIRRFTGNLDGTQTSVMILFPATSYTDTTVQPSTSYIYWIEARDLSGHGASTASASVTTPAASSGGSSTTTSLYLPNSQIASILEAIQRILNQMQEFLK